jgi:hypothetical protein
LQTTLSRAHLCASGKQNLQKLRARGHRLPDDLELLIAFATARHAFPSTSSSTFPSVFSWMFPSQYDRAMATSRHPVNAVRFRLSRVQRDWRDIVAILREAPGEPGYAGPDIDVLEKIEDVIAGVRVRVRDWILAGGSRRRPAPARRGRAAVVHAIRQAAAER